jgi:hypothetical protein
VAEGFTAINNTIQGFNYGIICSNNSRLKISNNYIYNVAIYGIWHTNNVGAVSHDNIEISGNTIDHSAQDPSSNTYPGIIVYGNTAYFAKRVRVFNNHITLPVSPTSSSGMGCELRYTEDSIYTNNTVYNGSMIVSIAACKRAVVDSNTGYGQNFYAIEIAGIAGYANNDIVVSNNVINGNGLPISGITMQGSEPSERCTVIGNVIYDISTGGKGIFVTYRWDNVSIVGNTIKFTSPSTGTGILLTGSTTEMINHVSICNNIVDGDATANNGLQMFNVSNAAVMGNVFENWLTASILMTANTLTMDYITIVGNVFTSTSNIEINTAVSNGGTFGSRLMIMGSPDYRVNGQGTNTLDLINGIHEVWSSATPEALVVAGVGSTYRRSGGAPGRTLYVKESGTGNTGWGAVPTSSGSTGGAGSAGSGNQYVIVNIDNIAYKLLHD